MTRRVKEHSPGRSADFSSSVVQRRPLVEILENKRILIENHLGVITYGQDRICIKTYKGITEITGRELEMICMSKERIVICGQIECVRLYGGEQNCV